MQNRRNGMVIYIAMFTMLLDHIGLLFFPDIDLFRSIGRVAFPIFAWSLTKGFIHTSNRKAYFKRLLLFAVLSQLPYSFLTPQLVWRPYAFNQIAQFVLSFLVLSLLEKGRKEKAYLLPAVLLIFLPDALELWYADFSIGYGSYGILMSVLFYLVNSPVDIGIGYLCLSLYGSLSTIFTWYGYPLLVEKAIGLFWRELQSNHFLLLQGLFFQWRSFLALPLLLYEHRLPYVSLHKWTAYLFYPLHMTVLIIIYRLLYALGVV